MRKQVERIQGRGTLTLDGATVLLVSYSITVYQKYVDTSGYGGKSYDPGGFEIEGTVTPENVTGFAVQCGQETNVLYVGKGRTVDINTPELLQRFQSVRFSVHDEMTFFDTPLYRKLEEEQR
jgi:hypothetical protein